MAVVSATKHYHALAVPLPAQGHLNPLMRFCRKLAASHGFTITFVNTDPIHFRIAELNQHKESVAAAASDDGGAVAAGAAGAEVLDIRRAHVPIEGLDLSQDFNISMQDFFESLKSLTPHLEKLLRGLQPPVTCLISDFFMTGPTQALADKFNLPRIALFTCSQGLHLFYSYIAQGIISPQEVLRGVRNEWSSPVFKEGLEGLPKALATGDLPRFSHVVDDNAFILEFVEQETTECHRKAHAIAVNSFQELEGPSFHTSSRRVKVPLFGVGPLVEPLEHQSTTSLWKEDQSCIPWLDSHPPLSVLYISFGSVTLISLPQFHQLLDALTSTKQCFLWAFRPGLVENSILSSSSLNQSLPTHAKGYFVDWAPQARVLSHPSIGGFLTHCGWNSTIEAIAAGVPMLCWPYITDQFLNAKYIIEEWKIGLRCMRSENSGLVETPEVERVIRALMDGEEGHLLRKNSTQLRKASIESTMPGGSSFKSIQALIHSL